MQKSAAWGGALFGAVMLSNLAHAVESGAALKGAVALGEPAIVTKLIEQGADVGATDQSGFTALAYAAQLDEPDVATVLINAGARPWTPDPATSPLMIAAVSGSSHVIAPLLSKGVPPVVYNDALTAAAGRGDPFTVTQIVQAAALSADDLRRLTAALNARLGSKALPGDALSPISALAALNTCRDAGLYSTDRCISAKLVEHLRVSATPIPPQDCDRLTTFLFDPDRLPDLKPVYFESLDAPKAIAACEAAIKQFPNEARFYAAAGRAYTRLGKSDATYYLRRAIEMHSRLGTFELASNYETGVGVDKSYEMAGTYFSKAANAGNYAAVNALGFMYQHGEGVSQNYDIAMRLYQTAAAHGDAQAMVNMGDMLAQGLGTERKPYAAFRWYRKAADTGYRNGVRALALSYFSGQGVDKDLNEALRLYEIGSKDGDPLADVSAGIIYSDNNSSFTNFDLARDRFESAIELNNTEAMWRLGLLYGSGRGTPVNHSKEFELYLRAAKAGAPEGMWRVGIAYSLGSGTPIDTKKGSYWTRQGANAGSGEAMWNLAYELLRAKSRPDNENGYIWMLKSLKTPSRLPYQKIVVEKCKDCTGKLVSKLQNRLHSLGFYSGALTNKVDEATVIAINNYIKSNK